MKKKYAYTTLHHHSPLMSLQHCTSSKMHPFHMSHHTSNRTSLLFPTNCTPTLPTTPQASINTFCHSPSERQQFLSLPKRASTLFLTHQAYPRCPLSLPLSPKPRKSPNPSVSSPRSRSESQIGTDMPCQAQTRIHVGYASGAELGPRYLDWAVGLGVDDMSFWARMWVFGRWVVHAMG
ncbi:hypothetical protein BDU57DRAFT_61865 [Ampelomyces quisqualis]|uniref:Uncharacterized protein n=1 Tax=Ampelomyces quisqualis TaxID=50730 RepID=A0A6A5R112_AMPQU|nr:hypothetical protein BDU57DRAFT_61865 [Ampelomyces quisqualis]